MIARDKKRQKMVQKYYARRNKLKMERKLSTDFDQQFRITVEFQKLPLNSSPTRLHNRCFLTGNPKGYYRFFGLSRHFLRSMAHQGLLPGVKKASW